MIGGQSNANQPSQSMVTSMNANSSTPMMRLQENPTAQLTSHTISSHHSAEEVKVMHNNKHQQAALMVPSHPNPQ